VKRYGLIYYSKVIVKKKLSSIGDKPCHGASIARILYDSTAD